LSILIFLTTEPYTYVRSAQESRVGRPFCRPATLDGASAVVEAVPAVEVEDVPETGEFSPFGRGDARTRSITADDTRLLAGRPLPLRIFVLVTVDG
jgi:hypothetical protein